MTTGENLNPDHFNITERLLFNHSESIPNKTALIFFDGESRKTYTYSEIFKKSIEIADYLLHFGFKPGNRLVIRMENSPEFIFSFLGVIAAGMTAIPVSPQLTEEEVNFIFRESKAETKKLKKQAPHQSIRKINANANHLTTHTSRPTNE